MHKKKAQFQQNRNNKSINKNSTKNQANIHKSQALSNIQNNQPDKVLEIRLAHKQKQLQAHKAKIVMLQNQNSTICTQIQKMVQQKQIDSNKFCQLTLQVRSLQQSNKRLQKELVTATQQRNKYKKKLQQVSNQKQMEGIKTKHEYQNTQKMNVYYKKQCEQMRKRQKHQQDKIYGILQIKQKDEENKLLEQLNVSLKSQIQELIFQLKMSKRREDVGSLNNYQRKIDLRRSLRKQFDEEDSSKYNQQKSQYVSLLTTRIHTLQHKLQLSQQRCRKLQDKLIQM